MESDLDRLKKLFDDFNIEYELEYAEEFLQSFRERNPDVSRTLKIEEGIGYFGFIAEFWFDAEGTFLRHGIWEE